jgi:hypothetical protein
MTTYKRCNTEVNDDVPSLIFEKSTNNLSRLASAKFASVTYDEVESSGPAAASLGFPAPRGKRMSMKRLHMKLHCIFICIETYP